MLLTVADKVTSFAQFITVFILFLFVLVITYVTTRYLAGVQKNRMKTENMELLEALRISASQYLQIVRVGERYLCMAVSKDSVTLLAELKGEELTITNGEETNVLDFKDIFDKVKEKASGNKKQDTDEDN